MLTHVRPDRDDAPVLLSTSEEHLDETVGLRLRRLRLERGLSQRELSGPGVSYAYISRIEAGERRPSVKALRVLAAKLGVSAAYLETGREITADEERELALADAELEIRLADDPGAASAKLEAILSEALSAGDRPSATRARMALGLAAAASERHEEAVQRLEEALAESALPPHVRADVYGTLGRSYTALDRHDDAVELFESCLAQIEEQAPGDVASYVRFATYLSYALTDSGNVSRARAVLKESLARARKSGDPYTRVRLYWSLARLSSHEGHATEALDYMRRAIALLEATDDTLHLGRAHLLSARIENGLGDATASVQHLEVAESLLGTTPEEVDLGMLRLEQSRAALLVGDGERAERLARESLSTFGPHHASDQGDAWLALADALATLDRDEDAERAYREAIELLEAHGHTQELPPAVEGLTRLLTRSGREVEAHRLLDSSSSVTAERDA